nr:unnamed protein product [Callosobruchus chinensis]
MAFNLLQASARAAVKRNEDDEYTIFGTLVAKEIQKYTPHTRNLVQQHVMEILFRDDSGFYDNQHNYSDIAYQPTNLQDQHSQYAYQFPFTMYPHSSSEPQNLLTRPMSQQSSSSSSYTLLNVEPPTSPHCLTSPQPTHELTPSPNAKLLFNTSK